MDTLAPSTVQPVRHWLYDWGGANVDAFLAIQRAWPDAWLWLPEVLSTVGSYWGAPAVVLLLLVWRRMQARRGADSLDASLCSFVLGFALAMAAAAVAKMAFALPRPSLVLGEAVYRAASGPDSRYTLPSGHSVYVGVLAVALWPLFGWGGRVGLLAFAAAVGWSRIVLGAHFPADVIVGLAIGGMCVASVGPWAERLARRLLAAGARR